MRLMFILCCVLIVVVACNRAPSAKNKGKIKAKVKKNAISNVVKNAGSSLLLKSGDETGITSLAPIELQAETPKKVLNNQRLNSNYKKLPEKLQNLTRPIPRKKYEKMGKDVQSFPREIESQKIILNSRSTK